MTNENPADFVDYKKKRRRKGSLRWILLALLCLLALVGGYFFANSAFFNVDKIEVVGAATVEDERVIQLSGIEKGVNIFAVNFRRVESFLKIEPAIKSAAIKRKWPGTIVITVEERSPAAIIPTGSSFIYIDTEAMVLSRQMALEVLDYPLVLGVANVDSGIMPGTMIDNADLTSVLPLLPVIADQIADIDISDMQQILVHSKYGQEVRLGNSDNIKGKYLVAQEILQNLQNEGKLTGLKYVDVSLPEKPAISYK